VPVGAINAHIVLPVPSRVRRPETPLGTASYVQSGQPDMCSKRAFRDNPRSVGGSATAAPGTTPRADVIALSIWATSPVIARSRTGLPAALSGAERGGLSCIRTQLMGASWRTFGSIGPTDVTRSTRRFQRHTVQHFSLGLALRDGLKSLLTVWPRSRAFRVTDRHLWGAA
jgi:hypothetical protein